MPFTKPNVNTVWASTGTSVAPTVSKIEQGWVSEIPTYENFNFILNRQDEFNAHVNQYGVAVWDGTTAYIADKSYVQGSDGNIYKALTNNTNSDPTAAGSVDWVRAFNNYDYSYSKAATDSKYLQISKNLSDVNAPAARTNLGITFATTAEANAGSNTTKYISPFLMNSYFSQYKEPAGKIIYFAGSSAPSGYLKANGAAVSRTAYSDLFAAIGTLHGTGDGSTTFNLPDLRGVVARGTDDGRGLDASRSVGNYQADQFGSHAHTGTTDSSGSHAHSGTTDVQGNHNHSGSTNTAGNHNHPITQAASDAGFGYPGDGSAGSGKIYTDDAGNHSHSLTINYAGNHSHNLNINSGGVHTHTFTTNSAGGNETRMKNIALLACIKY